MHFWASVAVLLSAWAAQVESASQFSQPPGAGPPNNYRDNPTYEIGERVDLQWQSDLEFMDLFLWLQWPSPVDQEVRYINLLSEQPSQPEHNIRVVLTLNCSKIEIDEPHLDRRYQPIYD